MSNYHYKEVLDKMRLEFLLKPSMNADKATYLFNVIDLLENQVEMLEEIIREKRNCVRG